MSALFFQIITTVAQLLILLFIVYYLIHLRNKEKELKRKEGKLDTAYQGIIEEALTKEKKIINDATAKAYAIIADAESMTTKSKETLDLALQKIATDMQKNTLITAEQLNKDYESSLKQLSTASLKDFESIFTDMKKEIQKETKEFHDTQMATLQKELDDYKQASFKQAEQAVNKVVQKTSREILTSAISLDDHQKLLIQSLEKARKEGMFD